MVVTSTLHPKRFSQYTARDVHVVPFLEVCSFTFEIDPLLSSWLTKRAKAHPGLAKLRTKMLLASYPVKEVLEALFAMTASDGKLTR